MKLITRTDFVAFTSIIIENIVPQEYHESKFTNWKNYEYLSVNAPLMVEMPGRHPIICHINPQIYSSGFVYRRKTNAMTFGDL